MAKFIPLSQGRSFQMGKGNSRHLVSPEIGATQITLNYSVFQPGHEFPQHLHDHSADIFIVLEGGVSVRQGDAYTPISAGEYAYIPPGEVHGTVNQTQDQAILISFQSPPDLALYRGERDPSVTGIVPTPPPGHRSQVQIRRLVPDDRSRNVGLFSYVAASPETGVQEMILTYYELDPGGSIDLAPSAGEAAWFAWSGEGQIHIEGETFLLSPTSALLVAPGESQRLTNPKSQVIRLIRCEAQS